MRFLRSLAHYAFRNSLRDLVRGLTAWQLLPLVLAIFFLFAVLGLMTDVMAGGRQAAPVVVVNTLLAGFLSVGYGLGSMRRMRGLILAAILVQVGWIFGSRFLLNGFGPIPAAEVPNRLRFDGIATLALIMVSYSCFLRFINSTAAKYLRYRAEIDLAREIHQVLVPAVATTTGGFEFAGFSAPSGDVGGDLVDVVVMAPAEPHEDNTRTPERRAPGPSADGLRWFGYVADVSGHGVSSGLVMGMFKSALRMRLLQGGPLSALLQDLNAVLFPLKSGSMFVTAACIRPNDEGGLDYAVAGHLPILRLQRDAAAVEEITTPQIPIGMFADYRFVSSTLACGPGDLLALITDGLTEVFDVADHELGMDPIKRLLVEYRTAPLAEIGDAILQAARAHGAQLDDQTLLIVRRL